MDRRRFKARTTGLHKDLQSESEASTRSDDGGAGSSRGIAKGPQKLSNSELLRIRQTRSTANLSGTTTNVSPKETIPAKKQTPPKSQKKSPIATKKSLTRRSNSDVDSNDSPTKVSQNQIPSSNSRRNEKSIINSPAKSSLTTTKRSLARRSNSDDDFDDSRTKVSKNQISLSNSRRNEKSIINSPAKSSLTTTKRSLARLSNSDDEFNDSLKKFTANRSSPNDRRKNKKDAAKSPEIAKLPDDIDESSDENVQKKRKRRSSLSMFDSDEEQERAAQKSPMKVRIVDTTTNTQNNAGPLKIFSQALRPPAPPKNSDIRPSQLNRTELSGRSSISLRMTASQRDSNANKPKKIVSPVKATAEQAEEIEEFVSPRKKRGGNRFEFFLRKSGITYSQDNEAYLLGNITDEEQERAAQKSPMKVRIVDTTTNTQNNAGPLKIFSQALRPPAPPKNSDIRPSQLNRTELSGRSSISLRMTASQRDSNANKPKKIVSPVKATAEQAEEIEEFVSPRKKRGGNRFEFFLRKSGITYSQDNEAYLLDNDPPIIENKMIDLITTGKFKKEEMIELWHNFVSNDDNLKRALNDVTILSEKQWNRAGINVSLVRIFLQVPALQTAVSDGLLEKLNTALMTAASKEDVPWAPLLLQQFRFLELIVDTNALTLRLDELLECCPKWFHHELILFLPDIVIDVQHQAIAEILSKLMDSEADLTGVVLECLTNLTLGKEYLEELRDKVLIALKRNLNIGRIPVFAKFVLFECPNVEVCQKVLKILRGLDLQPLAGEKADDYYLNQRLLMNALKMNILLSKNMSTAATIVVKDTKEDAKPLDFMLLLLVYSDPMKKKIADGVLKNHVKAGFYRPSLLNSFYNDYKEVARELQTEALQLAGNLLKSEDTIFAEFAVEWIRNQFLSQTDAIYKQREIIEKIILLMGDNDHTSKRALRILQKLTETEEDRNFLHPHCSHLRILLEKMDNFDLEEVAVLSDVLHALCTSANSSSEALQDDLFILLQKQLNNPKTLTKCKGVLGAAMAIKHLAGNPESCRKAEELFVKVEAGAKNCSRSQALFYDQIGRVIADTKNMHTEFLNDLTAKFQDIFVSTYMTDINDYKGELAPKYGLFDDECEPQKCVINFVDGKHGAVVPALFRLLRICFMRRYDSDLEEINLLLGIPLLMPADIEIPEPASLDLMICCINWFRELISGFVSQTDAVLQQHILKRLEDLMSLQATFNTQLTLADTRYQPPPFYFHRFPATPFVRTEKKIGKKGKRASIDKTTVLPEWEPWEMGCTLTAKNPTYFRQMDAKIIDLLNLKMDHQVSQSPKNISKAQVCFLIKEVLTMFAAGDAPDTLVRDLMDLLPKICSKLQSIVEELREKDDTKNRLAVKLILTLLEKIFGWKGFKSAMFHAMLRDGLRTLASQLDKSNSMLRSSRELVAESYKYFESLSDIATEISLAFAIVKICRTLMQHSDTFKQQSKSKQAKMASGFLNLEWPDDRSSGTPYKSAVVGLLANWLQNEPDPLETVTAVMEWLPEEVATLEKPQDRLERLPSITKACFHHMFQRLFEALVNGAKISFDKATSDPQRIDVWLKVVDNVKKIVEICQRSSRAVLPLFLRYMTALLRLFMLKGMPIMEHNLRYQTYEVKEIFKSIQDGTRYLNRVCVDSSEKKDVTLSKLVPAAKQVQERLVYHVKGMLVLNNSSDAFWMGALINKNLEGQRIFSQSSEDVTATSVEASNAEESESEDPMLEAVQSDVDDLPSDDE